MARENVEDKAAQANREHNRERRLMRAMDILLYANEGRTFGGYEVVSFKVIVAHERGGEALLIANGFDGAGMKVVAFQSGLGVEEVIVGFANRWQNAQLKWKEDTYAQKNGS